MPVGRHEADRQFCVLTASFHMQKEQLPELARAVFSGDEAAQFDATMQFRRLLSIGA